MFESDDFDQVLSQFDFPEVASVKPKEKENIINDVGTHDSIETRLPPSSENLICKPLLKAANAAAVETEPTLSKNTEEISVLSSKNVSMQSKIVAEKYYPRVTEKAIDQNREGKTSKSDSFVSPKHTKRKIINSYFDHQSKRKFPGPAGMLTGALKEPKDDSICQIELLSQDIDCDQHSLRKDLFESSIWNRLLSDTHAWKLHNIDNIKTIKQQALSGNLRRRKAQTVTAFVEAVDRSATDPLIILRDSTGSIKCTLHRDAWSTFSSYIVSEYCALVLQKPTVLTTGSAFKKHYLNITLSNIIAIYSSTVLNEDANQTLPDGYSVVYEEEFTVIKTEKCSESLETSFEQNTGAEDLFDGLDGIFCDDLF